MSWIFFILYFTLLALLVHKWSVFRLQNFDPKVITSLAAVKMLIGAFYVFCHISYINGGDVLHYFNDGNIIFSHIDNPLHFIQLVFGGNGGEIPTHLSEPIYAMGFWSDPAAYMVVRLNALFRLFSFGNIYTHGLFAGFLSFIGIFAIAKVFVRYLNASKIAILSLFLFPSLLFWTSGLQKESITVLCIGWITYFTISAGNGSFMKRYLILTIVAACLLFVTRSYLLLLFMPSIVAYLVTSKRPKYPLLNYFGVYALAFLLLVFLPVPLLGMSGLDILSNKIHQFSSLRVGNTSIDLAYSNYNMLELIQYLPRSLFNTIVRPTPGDINTLYLALSGVESWIVTFILITFFFRFRRFNEKQKNIMLFCLFYGWSFLIVIGWIVPNIGAILRYRSISLLFLVPIGLNAINFTKIFQLFSPKKNKTA